MINDNILSNRLNAFRSGEPLPEPDTQEYIDQVGNVKNKIYHLTKIGYELLNLSFVFLKSLAFGFALKTIFSTNWEFWPVLAVGFTLETITNRIFNLFNK